MEEEKLIYPKERKPQSRPKSSPSTHDTSPVAAWRPATAASRVVGTGDPLSHGKGQNIEDSLHDQARDEKQNINEKAHESGIKSEVLVHVDVKTSKVDEGWTEGNMAGGDDNTGMVNYNLFTQMIPYESPPKYCKR